MGKIVRALAEHWEATAYPAMSLYRTPVNSISLFVLLDLLGAASPRVSSYFRSTHWAYQHMATIEQRMRKLRLLESAPTSRFMPDADKTQFGRGFVQDDHIPFMLRGADVLHIIPTPFPRVWHTMNDDGEHLDGPTVQDWAKIVTAFAAEWMDLEGMLPPPPEKMRRSNKTEL